MSFLQVMLTYIIASYLFLSRKCASPSILPCAIRGGWADYSTNIFLYVFRICTQVVSSTQKTIPRVISSNLNLPSSQNMPISKEFLFLVSCILLKDLIHLARKSCI
jgi:hypothetical protein